MSSSSRYQWLSSLFVGVVALGAFTTTSAVRFVGNGENLVVFSWFGGVQQKTLEPGFHLITPLISKTELFDIKTQALTWKDQDPSAYDPRIISLSRDGQEVRMEITLQYRVIDAATTFTSLGKEYADYIAAITRSVVFLETAAFSAQDLYSTKRPILQVQIREKLAALLQERGILIQDLLIRDVGFSPDFVGAIEAKTIAENQLAQKDFEIEQARQDARSLVLQAQAEAGKLTAKANALKRNPQYLKVVKSQVLGNTLEVLVTK
ncbi:MAG: prohibitin family protein [Pseudanabaenaceae cyanobacterium bins.68]|nr:prohibitin family protein [Pseudanabaenaceae cyanobacterium bins.68]